MSVSGNAGSAGSNFFTAGSVTWSNTGNATGAPDGTSAVSGAMGSGSVSQSLDLFNWGLALPSGQVVTGIQIDVTARRPSTTRGITFDSAILQIGGVTGTPTGTS